MSAFRSSRSRRSRSSSSGMRVADEHPVRRPDRQRQRGEQALVRLVDLVRRRAVSRRDPHAEDHVEGLAVLADDPARQLRELVVAQDQVHPVGILALQAPRPRPGAGATGRPCRRGTSACRGSAPARPGAGPDSGRAPPASSTFLNAGRLPCRSPTTITSSAPSRRDDRPRRSRGLGGRHGRTSRGQLGSSHAVGCWIVRTLRGSGTAASPVRLEGGLPVLVQLLELLFQLPVAVLGADGLDRVAPGGGLAQQVLDLDDFLSSSPISRSISAALR